MNVSNVSSISSNISANVTSIPVLQDVRQLPSAVDAVLLMAITANCVLILSPLRAALRASKKELRLEELMGLLAPTYMLFGQSYFWACYGFTTGESDISHFNSFGAGMCLVYMCFISNGARQRELTQFVVASAVALVFVFSLGVMCTASSLDRKQVFACTALVFSSLQSLAPMYQAFEMMRKMSPTEAGFPLGVTASGFLSSILWAQYAVMVGDRVYFLSNAINSVIGLAQLGIVGWVTFAGHAASNKLFVDAECRPLMPRAGISGYGSWLSWTRGQDPKQRSAKAKIKMLPQWGNTLPEWSKRPGGNDCEKRSHPQWSNARLNPDDTEVQKATDGPFKSPFTHFEDLSEYDHEETLDEPEVEPEWDTEDDSNVQCGRELVIVDEVGNWQGYGLRNDHEQKAFDWIL